MQAEDLILDQRSQRQVVEKVGELFPNWCIAVFSKAFIVETVYLSDLTRLVITTKDGDSLWIADLEGNEKCDSLNREVTTIYIITWSTT